MKRLMIILSIATLAMFLQAATFRTAATYAENAVESKPVIFLVPHQDDETLSMGSSIIAHLNAGRAVHVVLVGDGTATNARNTLCSREHICLSETEIGIARDLEFTDAVKRLGVPAANIHFERQKEGAISIAVAQTIIRKYIATYGNNASYVTMSWLDTHPGHYNLGYALNSHCVPSGKNGLVPAELTDCRFYQSALYQTATPVDQLTSFDRVTTPSGGWYTASGSNGTRLLNAAAAYDLFDPSIGRYAIGARYSVPEQFSYLKTHLRSWWHKPSNGWADTASQANSTLFISRYQFRSY